MMPQSSGKYTSSGYEVIFMNASLSITGSISTCNSFEEPWISKQLTGDLKSIYTLRTYCKCVTVRVTSVPA